MEPTHQADKVKSEAFKTLLAASAKSWIKSSQPKGKWINCAGGMNRIMTDSQLADEPADEPAADPQAALVGQPGNQTVIAATATVDELEVLQTSAGSQTSSESSRGGILAPYPGPKSPSTDSNKATSPSRNTTTSNESAIGEEAEEDDPRSYDYDNNIVNCHTYSGGTDIDEMIWPNVMDEVLQFFKQVANTEDRVDERFQY